MRAVAAYRIAHGVADGEPRLGAVPMSRAARAAYRDAGHAINTAKRALGQPPLPLSDIERAAAHPPSAAPPAVRPPSRHDQGLER